MIRCERKPSDAEAKVTFSVPVGEPDQPVAVAGDFNGWDPRATPLKKSGKNRKASVVLGTGRRYAFRYVTTDGRWFDDDGADAYEPNEFGEKNCIVDLRDVAVACA